MDHVVLHLHHPVFDKLKQIIHPYHTDVQEYKFKRQYGRQTFLVKLTVQNNLRLLSSTPCYSANVSSRCQAEENSISACRKVQYWSLNYLLIVFRATNC